MGCEMGINITEWVQDGGGNTEERQGRQLNGASPYA